MLVGVSGVSVASSCSVRRPSPALRTSGQARPRWRQSRTPATLPAVWTRSAKLGIVQIEVTREEITQDGHTSAVRTVLLTARARRRAPGSPEKRRLSRDDGDKDGP